MKKDLKRLSRKHEKWPRHPAGTSDPFPCFFVAFCRVQSSSRLCHFAAKGSLVCCPFFSINTRPPVAFQLKSGGSPPTSYYLARMPRVASRQKNKAKEWKRKRAATNWVKTNMFPTFVFLNVGPHMYPAVILSRSSVHLSQPNFWLATVWFLFHFSAFAGCSKSCGATGWHFYEVIPELELHATFLLPHIALTHAKWKCAFSKWNGRWEFVFFDGRSGIHFFDNIWMNFKW